MSYVNYDLHASRNSYMHLVRFFSHRDRVLVGSIENDGCDCNSLRKFVLYIHMHDRSMAYMLVRRHNSAYWCHPKRRRNATASAHQGKPSCTSRARTLTRKQLRAR